MRRQHTHPCKTCGVPVSCRGQLEDNFDGWPPVVCVDYHLWWGEVADVFCEEHSNYDGEWDVPTDGESAAERDARLMRGAK